MGMLAVEVHKTRSVLGQRRRSREVAVHIGPTTAIGRHHPPQHHLVVAAHEPSLHHRLGSTWPHNRRISASSQEEVYRPHKHRLAGPGLPRYRGEPWAECDFDLVDHTQPRDAELYQHLSGPPSKRARRTLSDTQLADGLAHGGILPPVEDSIRDHLLLSY